MKELAREAKEARKQKAAPASSPQPAGSAEAKAAASDAPAAWAAGAKAYQRGRRSEDFSSEGSAVESFTEAIDLDPNNYSAFLHRGYAHFYLGDYAMAIWDISHSIEGQPSNPRG